MTIHRSLLWLSMFLWACTSCAGRRAAPAASPVAPPPRILGIARVAFVVSDLGTARSFYRDLLGFTEAQAPAGGSVYEVNALQSIELREGPAGVDGRFGHAAFYTDDAARLRGALAARGVQAGALTTARGGQPARFSLIDPDGHALQMIQLDRPTAWAPGSDQWRAGTVLASHLAHVGYLAASLGAALRFYGDTLGFRELWRGSAGGPTLDWVGMRVPDGEDYVELMLHDQLPAPPDRGTKNHLCLFVADIARAVAVLEARPARRLYSRPIQIKVGRNHRRQANLFDPDGNRVELMEPHTVDGQPTPSSTAPPPRP